jgi:hypothetical protein
LKILYFSGKNKGIDFEDKRRNGQVVSEDCPITRKSASGPRPAKLCSD